MKEKPKKSVRMWVARDKDGELFLFKNKPKKNSSVWNVMPLSPGICKIDPDLFPSVKWEDSEPTKVTVRLS